jgi:dTDP-glucose 4,6-dehydratase
MSDISDPVNIGNPDEITMLDLAKEIISATNSKSEIIYQDLPEDDPKVRKPDTTIANTKLGWKASVDRKEGLKHTIEYFKKKLHYES